MIDHPDQVERLLVALRAALPMPARMTPKLLASLRDQLALQDTVERRR